MKCEKIAYCASENFLATEPRGFLKAPEAHLERHKMEKHEPKSHAWPLKKTKKCLQHLFPNILNIFP